MLKFSHILCKVDDIHQVVRDYENLGFTMTWGTSPEKAHNALLWFKDGPYIEFFQLPKKYRPMHYLLSTFYGKGAGKRWKKWADAPEGWCDLALEPDVEESVVNGQSRKMNALYLKELGANLKNYGIHLSRLIKGKRTDLRKEKVRYSLLCPSETGFPFLFSGYDRPQRPGDISHANGATSISTIEFGCSKEMEDVLTKLTGKKSIIRISRNEVEGIGVVGINGLRRELPEKQLHGARFILEKFQRKISAF